MLHHNLSEARQPIDRDELHRQLDLLLNLRDRSHPDHCADPSSLPVLDPAPSTHLIDGVEHEVVEVYRGKHNCALWATSVAEGLVISAAGWAFNHLLGNALSATTAPDAHDAERLGQKAAFTGEGLEEAPTARKALLALLERFPMPLHLLVAIREALTALDFGEVLPLLAPSKVGRHGRPYTLAGLRMKAIEHANFNYGKGMKLIQAETRIARFFGIEQSTLKSWETRFLPEVLGKKHVRETIERARQAGKLIEEVRDDGTRIAAILAYAGTREWELLVQARLIENEDIKELASRYLLTLRDQ